jgi:tetratricopeptide (TPR) repeat protein
MSKRAAPAKAQTARRLALADTHMAAGRWAQAATACRRALDSDPRCAGALHRLGVIASRAGDMPGAIDLVRRATLAEGASAAAFSDLCEMCRVAGRLDEALEAGHRALAIEPGLPQALNSLGIVHFDRGEYADAADCYRRALAQAPDLAQAHSNLANALRRLRRLDEAVASYRRAIQIDPDFADAWSNLGSALNVLGRREEALDAYRMCVAKDPLNGNGQTGLAMQMLLRGDFAQGWCAYEWRWRSSDLAGTAPRGPLWQGDELAGRRLVVHAEQGLGDTIQLARYAQLLARAGANLTLVAPRPLVRLLSASLGGVKVVGDDEPAPDGRLHCPLFTLPLAMATGETTVPAPVGYLRAPRAEAAKWAARLGAGGSLRVGIAWAGNPKHDNDDNRSIAPAELAPLLAVDGVRWVSLQVGPAGPRGAAPPGCIDAAAHIDDFLDTAAAITALDLVISIDSAVAHLAGAVGVPTWVLLPVGCDWRWRLEGEASAWYPTMRLFRQRTYGDWAPVAAQAAQALRGLFAVAA